MTMLRGIKAPKTGVCGVHFRVRDPVTGEPTGAQPTGAQPTNQTRRRTMGPRDMHSSNASSSPTVLAGLHAT